MKHFGRLILSTLGLGLFAIVVLSLPNHPAAADGGPAVLVTNTAAQAVPVSGTVGVNNFPATQSVSGTVSISNFPVAGSSVNVTNPPGSPALARDVDNPARHPFQATCNTTTQTNCLVTTVPAGQELVIQGATFRAFINPGPGSSVDADIITSVNGTFGTYTVGMLDLGPAIALTGQPHEYTGIVPFTMYADPGTQVSVGFNRGFVFPISIDFTGTISGYLVSVP